MVGKLRVAGMWGEDRESEEDKRGREEERDRRKGLGPGLRLDLGFIDAAFVVCMTRSS